ncbi:MAG: proline--tRNA ligase, partial [Actinomycetota bacterium]|nr:proline--tRNA ligase [Actinomycetota bacterium]
VQASSGSMGGSSSIEFMVESPAGEDDVLRCLGCGYQANVELGTSTLESVEDPEGLAAPERFATPGVRTIAALEEMDGGATAERQIKTMVMVLDGELTLALVRGDHQLNLQKLQDQTGAIELRPAEAAEALEHLGANPGSLGAVEVEGLRIIADHALSGRHAMTTGANEDDWHLRGVDVERDIAVDQWADLREVQAGEACPRCGAVLEIVRCIEAGHIFKLGRKYADALGVSVLDVNGKAQTPLMGCYGIGIGRALAAVAENHHDDSGLIWPMSVAPYEVAITVMSVKDERLVAAGEQIYQGLRDLGVDAILDDRDARAGVKFADAELVGIPLRITVGGRGLDNGEVELTPRMTGETEMLAVDSAVRVVHERVLALR